MLKSLLLTIKGWFRNKTEEATDLRYAGKEHIHQIKQSIEEVRAQRNQIAGEGILVEGEVEEVEKAIKRDLDAVKHWDAQGDQVKRDRAYNNYKSSQQQLDKLKARQNNLTEKVLELDELILRLENDTVDAKDQLDDAATNQVFGRATTKVEDIHTNLNSGPLAGAIENSKSKTATAEAARRARVGNDSSDLYAYQSSANTMSLDEILGKPDMKDAVQPLTEKTSNPYVGTPVESHRPHTSSGSESSTSSSDSSSSSSSID